MLVEETLPTLPPVPGIDPQAYVEQSLGRLRNTAIRHRNHQIATDGSQKIVQRLLNPIRERLRRGQGVALLPVAGRGWMVYLILARTRFGRALGGRRPLCRRIAAIADRDRQRHAGSWRPRSSPSTRSSTAGWRRMPTFGVASSRRSTACCPAIRCAYLETV